MADKKSNPIGASSPLNSATPIPPGDYILRPRDTAAKVGLCLSQIYFLSGRGQFPKPVKLGQRASGFISSEVDTWIADRVAARDSGTRAA